YFLTLIDGVEMDLMKNRYENFEELKEYCYAVASIVGLITIEIFGYKFERTKEYAVDLGIALQLTNILRDVKKDASMGRIYLRKIELAEFNVFQKRITVSTPHKLLIAFRFWMSSVIFRERGA